MATTSVLMLSGVRKKRDPYTPVACSTCKRRKIKCTGKRPCAACVASESECTYERYSRFRPRLQSQVTDSQGSPIPAIEAPTSTSAASTTTDAAEVGAAKETNTSPSASRGSGYTPPGSSDFFLNLAEELHVGSEPLHIQGRPQSRQNSISFTQLVRQAHEWRLNNSSGSLVRFVGLQSWLHVLHVYEEEIGLQNPFIDLGSLREDVKATCQELAPEPGPLEGGGEHVLILILALVAVLESLDVSQLTDSFTQKSRQYAASKSHGEVVKENTIQLLVLISIYNFLTDRENLAWRCIGSALRVLQELGYHSSKSFHRFNSLKERNQAENLFWVVYILDRRWSFGTGLPFAISESDIDHDIETGDESLSSAYVRSMVAYCRIATECRSSILGQGSSRTARDFSDFRVVEWRLKESRSRYRLRLLLYLRANQMRTVIRRHSAFRSGQAELDPSSLQTALDVACDTIRVLVTVVRTSDVYQAQQKTFNHFLESALSSLLLFAGRHRGTVGAPYRHVEELHMAMALVRGLSDKSWMMRKLCDKLERLKVVQAALKSREGALSGSLKVNADNYLGGEQRYRRRDALIHGDRHTTPTSKRPVFHTRWWDEP
ncbi:unnamed protein product [Parascedosporium putredinis]|uniref:Zn(2)-C6 fungal-type domain-containing protein n=1 Tax=Parascedosporium putredinis TaxID=1442378 RepID=A0A9P1H8Y1_9PEZI|nr:unnamed protein product [Parascedosporium putredinis]CAI8000266.1 unnamed protein product [Parascedosporium putredinis]